MSEMGMKPEVKKTIEKVLGYVIDVCKLVLLWITATGVDSLMK